MGLPHLTLDADDLAALMDTVVLDPEQEVAIDLEARTVRSRAGTVDAGIPDSARRLLLDGSWNATEVMLEAGDGIETRVSRIPYLNGFPG